MAVDPTLRFPPIKTLDDVLNDWLAATVIRPRALQVQPTEALGAE
jgi:hypothetical protein